MLTRLPLLACLSAGCGLSPLADCPLAGSSEVDDDTLLPGATFTAAEARDLPTDFRGTIQWASGAEEPAALGFELSGPNRALQYQEPERCPLAYEFEAVADVRVAADSRYRDQAAPGTLRVDELGVGVLSLAVDLGEPGGLRITDDFDPADYDDAWIQFELALTAEGLAGSGTWVGLSGEDEVSSACCTVSLDLDEGPG